MTASDDIVNSRIDFLPARSHFPEPRKSKSSFLIKTTFQGAAVNGDDENKAKGLHYVLSVFCEI